MPKLGMQPIRRRQLIDATLDAINEVGMHDATIAKLPGGRAYRRGSSVTISKEQKWSAGGDHARHHQPAARRGAQPSARSAGRAPASACRRLSAATDETQISSAAMRAWLAPLGQQHAPADALSVTAGQQPSPAVEPWSIRIPPRAAARRRRRPAGLAALIDGLWLRAALSWQTAG